MPDIETLTPRDAADLAEAVAQAAVSGTSLDIRGFGTKAGFGRPETADRRLSLAALRGVSLYEPEELVLTAGPATPLAEIEAILAQSGQQFAFEPPDWGPLWGQPAEQGSLGGVIACNLGGPRRLTAGAARDHFLGFQAVNGRGERFKAGGRVVKNVTGYDLPKLMAGSFGTLAILTEITCKTLPRPETSQTVLLMGQDDAEGLTAIVTMLQGQHDIAATAHLPAPVAAMLDLPGAATLFRLEGPEPSVAARRDGLAAALVAALPGNGSVDSLTGTASAALWRGVRDASPLVARPELLVWRLSLPPTAGASVMARIGPVALHWYDWAGGLLWLGLEPGEADGGAARVRAALDDIGGHATLLRAPDACRTEIDVFHPPPPVLAALEQRVKASFDPGNILNPGRMRLAQA